MMATLKMYHQLFLRLIIFILGVNLSFFLFQKGMIYAAFFLGLLLFLLLIELYVYLKNAFLLYDKTIQAILQNDFSADYSKHKDFKNYSSLFELYENLKSKQNDQISKDSIYRSILNNIETGILILQKEEKDWSVFLMNDYFSNHFSVPKVSKWHYLKNQLPLLCNVIEEQDFEDIKTSLQIRVNKQDTQTFVLQASRSKTFHQEYYIVLLDSIQKVIEKKEKEAWINLMKVISHELLNSLTPIRSLSQNLYELAQQDSLSPEDLDDMKQSVSTMLNRSNHLQEFVESYRKLAMLPSPKKEKIELKQLIASSLQIMLPLFKKENIEICNIISFNKMLDIDKNQMEQVLINLFTNSIFALENQKGKKITINAEAKEKRIFITITDTGIGIDTAIEDKIFLPFFTTRKEGAGIGLTLSKSIVEAHGGYLTYKSEESKTTFLICLIDK
jgi:two-component system, NtrC family, nitrogen regulation sensor histidine kinase NtrY